MITLSHDVVYADREVPDGRLHSTYGSMKFVTPFSLLLVSLQTGWIHICRTKRYIHSDGIRGKAYFEKRTKTDDKKHAKSLGNLHVRLLV